MANRIKGITLDIDGDSSKLQKSISAVDKSLKATEASLRDVNKLLKFDPKNTELLEQKQKLLGSAIGDTKKRLEELKSASQEAQKALEAGTMTQDQYDALQREIAETESSLKNLEKQAKETEKSLSGIEKAKDALDKVGKKAEEVGKTLSTHVTAPIAAVGGAAFAAFKDVDSGLDIVKKKVGTVGVDLEEFEEVYKNVFGSMPVSAEEAGNAVGEVSTRFGSTGKDLEDLSKLFLRFSKITDTDVTQAVASTDKIMEKFGVDIKDTDKVLGRFAKLGQDTGIPISTLTGALEGNGAQLKQMGFDLYESAELLAKFEQNGIDSTTAMTGLKKTVQNATKDGKDARTALEEMITTIRNSQSEIGALEYATELFGAKAAPEMTQAIREGRLSIDDLSGSLSSYEDVVDDTFTATQDAGDDATVAFNNLKLAGSELGATIGQVLSPVLLKLADAFRGLSQWYQSLDPQQQKMIVTIALLAATIGPLLIVLAKLIFSVKIILGVLPAVKAAVLAVNGALAANPIALVVAAIAALVAAFVLLWNNCDEFRQFWLDMWEALKEGAITVIDGIQLAFTQLGEGFQTVGDGIMLMFDTIGGGFNLMGETASTICSNIEGFFSDMGETVKGVWDGMWAAIKAVINTIIGGINGMIAGIEGGLNAVIGALNTLHFEIPDWVPGLGGKGFGFDIPKANFGRIPELAAGGVIPPNNPFLAVLGDQKTGTNIEAPLSTIKEALVQALNSSGMGAGQIVIPVYIGKERIQTIVASATKQNAFLSGGH